MLSFSAAAGGLYIMGVSLQKKRIRLSDPKDAKRFTAHQASLIVIFLLALSLPILSGMNTGTADICASVLG